MTSDCALLIAAMRRSSELEIMEQVNTSSVSPQPVTFFHVNCMPSWDATGRF